MKTIRSRLFITLFPALSVPLPALTHIETVTVGNPRNAPVVDEDGRRLGRVAEIYRIGKFEITNRQYCDFLNAVASKGDAHGLFDSRMESDPPGGITRHLLVGGINTYSPKTNFANKPVTFVSFVNACRFANWLHHHQPSGGQTADTTEDGAYTMSAAAIADHSLQRNAGARFAIPGIDEWLKAAHYDPVSPGADNEVPDYWMYPTQSDTPPVPAMATSIGDVANPGPNTATIDDASFWGGISGSVTTVGSCQAPSHYGTYDQAGNAMEQTETRAPVVPGYGLRLGGSARSDPLQTRFGYLMFQSNAVIAEPRVGFRIVQLCPAIPPETVEIGAPGNAADNNGRGQVAARYRIGRYEVTNDEYAVFLNAQAHESDPAGLWDPGMESAPQGGIARTGSALSGFVFWVKQDFARKPVNFVSYRDAVRFCNWLHNGQPVGGQSGASTESGAYDFSSFVTISARKAGARFFLPSINEWHKAAHFDPDNPGADAGGTANYWMYPMMTDTAPLQAVCDAHGDVINGGAGNVATYRNGAWWNGDRNVTTVGSAGPGSVSAWGCADMAGNVREWNDGDDQDPVDPWAPMTDNGYTGSIIFPGGSYVYLEQSAASSATGFRVGAATTPVSMNFRTIGTPGNASDYQSYHNPGAVGRTFRLGALEVTNHQYASFLNAVGAVQNDPHGLFSSQMASNVRGGIHKITLLGVTSFQSRPNMGDKPVNFVSWWDAARFCNWLHHGQPRGNVAVSQIEYGAYDLDPGLEATGTVPGRQRGARRWLPNVDEWYKAAYFDPAKPGGTDYWKYPHVSNTEPLKALATPTGATTNPGPNTANFGGGATWNGANGNLLSAGSTGSRSPWGIADMGGSVTEWGDTTQTAQTVAGMGGNFLTAVSTLKSDDAIDNFFDAAEENAGFGFRVASGDGIDADQIRMVHIREVNGTDIEVGFTTQPGRTYGIEFSINLNFWTGNGFPSGLQGTGGVRTVIIPNALIVPSGFLRAVEE